MSKWCNTCHRNEITGRWQSCSDSCPIFGKDFDELAKIVINDNYFEAVEVCPHCGSENTYPMWNTEESGFVAVCNHCGKEIFLCDECIHAEDKLNENCCYCDWCSTECGGKCFRGTTRN